MRYVTTWTYWPNKSTETLRVTRIRMSKCLFKDCTVRIFVPSTVGVCISNSFVTPQPSPSDFLVYSSSLSSRPSANNTNNSQVKTVYIFINVITTELRLSSIQYLKTR